MAPVTVQGYSAVLPAWVTCMQMGVGAGVRLTKETVQGAWWVTEGGEVRNTGAPTSRSVLEDMMDIGRDCLESKCRPCWIWRFYPAPWGAPVSANSSYLSEGCVTPHRAFTSCVVDLIKSNFHILNEVSSMFLFSVTYNSWHPPIRLMLDIRASW